MPRVDGRTPAQMREVLLQPDFVRKNDCLVSYGATKVEPAAMHSAWMSADVESPPLE